MPKRAWPLWVLTVGLLVAFPVLSMIYWDAVLGAGELCSNSDTIAIPIAGSVAVTVALSPVILAITWLCLRRYNPATRLATLRWDRPVRTITASLVFGGTTVLIMLDLIISLKHRVAWYEHLWTGYSIALALWLLGLRAAVIDQRSPTKD